MASLNQYIAWIPTALGHLFFDVAGRAKHMGKYHIIHKKLNKDGYLECLDIIQQRLNPDTVSSSSIRHNIIVNITKFLIRLFYNHNIIPYHILLAQEKKDEESPSELRGVIITVWADSKQSAAMQTLEHLVTEAEIKYNNSPHEKSEWIKDNIHDGFSIYATSEFSLQHSGIIEFYKIEYKHKNEIESKKTQQIIEQQYYFIKEAFHSHAHHDPYQETLLPVCKNINELNDKVHKNLLNHLIKYRPKLDNASLGIFSYIESFDKIPDIKTSTSKYPSIESLRSSIESEIKNRSHWENTRRWLYGLLAIPLLIQLKETAYSIINDCICFIHTSNCQTNNFYFTCRNKSILIVILISIIIAIIYKATFHEKISKHPPTLARFIMNISAKSKKGKWISAMTILVCGIMFFAIVFSILLPLMQSILSKILIGT